MSRVQPLISRRLPFLTPGSPVKVCDRVSRQPLPIRVTSVRGHGEFFDRGDPIPKHATLTVDGVEDPLVDGLELDQLCSKALAERARRRNEQVLCLTTQEDRHGGL